MSKPSGTVLIEGNSHDESAPGANADSNADIRETFDYADNILATLREPFIVLSKDLRVKTANRSFYQTFHVSPEETQHQFIYDLGNRQWDIPALRSLLEEVLSTHYSVHDYEVEHDFQTIGQKIMRLKARRIREPGNHSELILLAFEDITERKQRELNLAFLANVSKDFASLSFTDEIMQMAGERIAAYFKLSHCIFTEINEAAGEAVVLYDQHAVDAASLVGVYRLADFHTEEERGQLASGKSVIINDVRHEPRSAAAAAAFEALGIRALITAPYSSGGRWKFALSAQHRQPYQWSEDESNLLNVLAAQIYERIERSRAEAVLRESEERFRSLFYAIDEGFLILELIFDAEEKPIDWHYLQANPAFEKMTGLPNPVGRKLSELVPDLEPFWVETFGTVAVTGEAVRFENYAEPLSRWFDVHASRIGSEAERRVAVVFNNITERKCAEAEREHLLTEARRLRETAEAATHAKDEFLAIVSHELRNPLNSILGYARLLRTMPAEAIDAARIKKTADIIERSGQAQLELINDLLDTARIISGKLKLEIVPLDLSLLINDAIEVMRPAADAKKIALLQQFDPGVGQIVGDPQRLQQVILNLINNAVKFTQSGGSISVTLRRAGADIII